MNISPTGKPCGLEHRVVRSALAAFVIAGAVLLAAGPAGATTPASYGVDDIADALSRGTPIGVNGSGYGDEINHVGDVDAYTFPSDSAQHIYRMRTAGKDQQVASRLYYWNGSWWVLLASDTNGGGCDFSYTSNVARRYGLKVSGVDGYYSATELWLTVTG